MNAKSAFLLLAALALPPLSLSAADAPPQPAATAPALNPLPGLEAQAPALKQKTTVLLKTNAGDVRIQVYPAAAPNAVKRFLELVKNGFYNNTPVSRVVPGFVAQFGINWRKPYRAWEENYFKDDPSLFALERGTLAFAKAGADHNSTQVFINYAENNRLAVKAYNFTVFGKVTGGMDVVDKFVEVGEPGMGLDQDQLWNDGENYLKSLSIKPTMILAAEIVK
ncbi:MAG TPA: peptidylprolyl isomerase [Candidatus Acidoferrum sp.]|nr:peptidylprolyl isomerase [Candidatus Acidoferrum sp.]